MRDWFAPPRTLQSKMFENIVLRDKDATNTPGMAKNYFEKKICDGTFTNNLTEKDTLTYEFAM